MSRIDSAGKRVGMRLVTFGAVALMFLTGCGRSLLWGTVKENTLAVAKNGEVTLCLVDSFEEDYYSLEELSEYARAEAAAYNTEHPSGGEEDAVTVECVELLGDEKKQVLLREKFDSMDTYEAFAGGILFTGTVGGALEKGFDLEQKLCSAKDGSELPEDCLELDYEQKLLITDLKGIIYVPGQVWALSQGKCLQGGAVDTKGTQGSVLLLLK